MDAPQKVLEDWVPVAHNRAWWHVLVLPFPPLFTVPGSSLFFPGISAQSELLHTSLWIRLFFLRDCGSKHREEVRMDSENEGFPQIKKKGGSSGSLPTHIFGSSLWYLALPWWLRRSSICPQGRRPGFHPWVRKIPWRREWQPTPVFLPGESHVQRSLAGYSPWVAESDTVEWLTLYSISLLTAHLTTALYVLWKECMITNPICGHPYVPGTYNNT